MAITPLPTPPSRNDPTNFAARADAFLAALPDFATEANSLASDVNADAAAAAADAADAAAAAVAATAAANATKWISGTTYTEGAVVWSPINYLTYRRKSTGGGTTDPSADSTNWAQAAGTGDVTQTGTQTLTNKTLVDPILTLGADQGTAGQVPVSQGAGLPPVWAAVGGVGNDYQEFLSSGTWTKPSGATWVYVEAIGGGGGGRSGAFSGNNVQGGGGGEFTSRLMRASDVAATVTVTVGAGGAGGPIGGDNGSNGGNSTFGSHVTGRGGAGGRTGAANTSFTGLPGGPTGTSIESIGGAIYPQAGPGGAPNANGVSTIYGGAGGGGCNGTNRNGGTSLYGGNGGNAVAAGAGQNGSQPGGGGGANNDSSNPAGSGGAGRVRVWAW